MKWTDFRELTPEQRRECRRSRSHGFKARQRFMEKAARSLPRGDFQKHPESRHIVTLISGYANSKTPEEIGVWLNQKVDIRGHKGGWLRLAAFELLILGKEYPDTVFGFFNEDNTFVPGLLPLMARKIGVEDIYTDPLDDILSEEIISGLTLDEVVAMAGKRGMRG